MNPVTEGIEFELEGKRYRLVAVAEPEPKEPFSWTRLQKLVKPYSGFTSPLPNGAEDGVWGCWTTQYAGYKMLAVWRAGQLYFNELDDDSGGAGFHVLGHGPKCAALAARTFGCRVYFNGKLVAK